MPQSSRRTTTEGDTEATDSASVSSETEATEATTTEDADSPFYCPGCGRRYEYRQQCTGSPDQPHAPIEVVSTDELKAEYNPDAKPGESGYYAH